MNIQISLEAFIIYHWLAHCYMPHKLIQISNSLSTSSLSSVGILVFLIWKLQNVFFAILRALKVLGRQGRDAVDIVGWTDSDWAGDIDSRCSVGGFVFDVARGCVSWSSKKQVSVTTSSVEAEYVTLANATKEAVWLRTLLKEVGYSQSQATIVHANNQGAIALAQNPISHSRAKHIVKDGIPEERDKM